MTSIGWSFLVGGTALVVCGLILQLATGQRRSRKQVRARTDESLDAINHYLREIRQQRNDYAERLRNAHDIA